MKAQINDRGAARHSRVLRGLLFAGLPAFLACSAVAAGSVPGAPDAKLTATHVVSSCADSGSGTLRALVLTAASGDTVDASACTVINLASSIQVNQTDLVIRGQALGTQPGGATKLDGQALIRPLQHMGIGTLTLENLDVANGVMTDGVARGGCISSLGNVKLVTASVHDCVARRTAGTDSARGGGIFAEGNISLDHSFVRANQAINDGSGHAQGGGLHAASGWVSMQNDSRVESNRAFTSQNIGTAWAEGGGIWAGRSFTIRDSIVRSNTATALPSGSIWTRGGGISLPATAWDTSEILRSHITQNVANYGIGGGLSVDASEYSVTITASRIAGNTAAQGGGLFLGQKDYTWLTNTTVEANSGGGIYSKRGTFLVSGGTFADNTSNSVSVGGGAGVWLETDAGNEIIIVLSTFSGNRNTLAGQKGAGLFLRSPAQLTDVTVTDNQGTTSGTGFGIWLENGAELELVNSVVANNRLGSGSGSPQYSDIDGTVGTTVIGDHDFVGTSTLALPAGTIGSNDPELGPLADNGGPTRTHLPLPGSPLIDVGHSIGNWDQRGNGFPRVVGVAADIGSTEYSGDRIFADGFES